jgi:flagellin
MQLDLTTLANPVQYNLDQNQSAMLNTVKQLSSGLRINTAADDPSGLAIATNLQTVSLGIDQGQQSVQEANNALAVADGALATVTSLLQRMRSLVVEANSDLNSAGDIATLQAEINQLTQEINSVAENTQFNGKKLLDGSLSTAFPKAAYALYAQNPNTHGTNLAQPLIDPTQFLVSPTSEQVTFGFSVDSYDPVANVLNVTVTASSPDPAFGPTQTLSLTVANNTNFFAEVGFDTPIVITDQSSNPVFQFEFNTINQNDVGLSSVIATVPTQDFVAGSGLQVNSGRAEGDTVAISIDAVDAYNLGVSQITLGGAMPNEASLALYDNAITQVNDNRANIGAQEVALNEQSANLGTQEVAQTTSESAIRDLNVGSATTQFAKLQILASIGTSVLSSLQQDASQVIALVNMTFAATAPAATGAAAAGATATGGTTGL